MLLSLLFLDFLNKLRINGFRDQIVETRLIIFGFVFGSCVEKIAASSADGV